MCKSAKDFSTVVLHPFLWLSQSGEFYIFPLIRAVLAKEKSDVYKIRGSWNLGHLPANKVEASKFIRSWLSR